jgi:cell division protein ZapA (FtsZ GTPase activity inhibitor)
LSESQPVKIKVYGREYTIKSSQDPQVTRDYAAYIDSRIREIAQKSGSFDMNFITVLTLLQITHELFALRKQTETDAHEYERIMDKLLEKMETSISRGGVQAKIIGDKLDI